MKKILSIILIFICLFLTPGCLPVPPAAGSVWVSILVRPVENGACLAKEVLIIDDQETAYQIQEAAACNKGSVELPPGRSFARFFVVSDLALVEVEIFTP